MRKRIIVRGVVQGVGFRFFTSDLARRLGIAGFVRNLPDGGVEIEAEGEERQISALLSELRIGPPAAHVAAVDVDDIEENGGHEGFRVRM